MREIRQNVEEKQISPQNSTSLDSCHSVVSADLELLSPGSRTPCSFGDSLTQQRRVWYLGCDHYSFKVYPARQHLLVKGLQRKPHSRSYLWRCPPTLPCGIRQANEPCEYRNTGTIERKATKWQGQHEGRSHLSKGTGKMT